MQELSQAHETTYTCIVSTPKKASLSKFILTSIIREVDEQPRYSGCLERLDGSIGIRLELYEVALKRPNKQLRNRQSSFCSLRTLNKTVLTTPVLFPGKINDLITPVLPG